MLEDIVGKVGPITDPNLGDVPPNMRPLLLDLYRSFTDRAFMRNVLIGLAEDVSARMQGAAPSRAPVESLSESALLELILHHGEEAGFIERDENGNITQQTRPRGVRSGLSEREFANTVVATGNLFFDLIFEASGHWKLTHTVQYLAAAKKLAAALAKRKEPPRTPREFIQWIGTFQDGRLWPILFDANEATSTIKGMESADLFGRFLVGLFSSEGHGEKQMLARMGSNTRSKTGSSASIDVSGLRPRRMSKQITLSTTGMITSSSSNALTAIFCRRCWTAWSPSLQRSIALRICKPWRKIQQFCSPWKPKRRRRSVERPTSGSQRGKPGSSRTDFRT